MYQQFCTSSAASWSQTLTHQVAAQNVWYVTEILQTQYHIPDEMSELQLKHD
jgi:hypothetical protein